MRSLRIGLLYILYRKTTLIYDATSYCVCAIPDPTGSDFRNMAAKI